MHLITGMMAHREVQIGCRYERGSEVSRLQKHTFLEEEEEESLEQPRLDYCWWGWLRLGARRVEPWAAFPAAAPARQTESGGLVGEPSVGLETIGCDVGCGCGRIPCAVSIPRASRELKKSG